MNSWVEAVQENDFVAHASAGEGTISVSLTGTADLTVRSQLDHFLHEVHAEAQRCLAHSVTVDVRQLEFINSSCLKSLVWWVSTVDEQSGDGKYRIVFLSSPTARGPLRSLNSLACIASDVVTVQA
jgi:hypothetical protein